VNRRDRADDPPRVGLAYGPGVAALVARERGLADYIEIPFEQLRHAPALARLGETTPLLLHCASLSIAGFVSPSASTVAAVADRAQSIGTPWIGEHLAFVAADSLADDPGGSVTTLSYTVCPQLSEQTVERVAENLAGLRAQLPVPLILENSPQYFAVPGSTMSMSTFIATVAERCDVDLLLDLSHFLITALNTGADPLRELDLLPLERVVEVHISGLNRQSGVVWDDHATPAPPLVFELLERVLKRARPRALTLEYNWSAHFPVAVLRDHVDKARALLQAA
jgi:hypothetical protein